MKKNTPEKNKLSEQKNFKAKIFFINFVLIFSAVFVISSFGNENFSKNSEKISTNQEKISNNVKNVLEKTEEKKSPEIKKVQNLISYKLYRVLDGDTIKIFDKNGQKKSVRMVGIDTPESYKTRFGYKECYGDEASNYLKKIVGNSEKVQVELDATQGNKGLDRYGRLLGYVFLHGENLNEKMIKDGFAWEFTYYGHFYKYQKEFRNDEKFALTHHLGL